MCIGVIMMMMMRIPAIVVDVLCDSGCIRRCPKQPTLSKPHCIQSQLPFPPIWGTFSRHSIFLIEHFRLLHRTIHPHQNTI
uniref:Secreted protein n=1 Tax=Cannabis sativa TaxID=3483 RepID=A0A803QWR7_CANSA